ncbi:MAG: 3'-5' exonuclease [Motilibacteraceae bacterium]
MTIPGGRSTVLRSNYRNRAEILRTALDVVNSDQFDDLDEDPELGRARGRDGSPRGHVLRAVADDGPSLVHSLHNALTWGVRNGLRLGDLAVLVRTNAEADAWCRDLTRLGVASQSLKKYKGLSSDAVKVGTYQRAKGLEFACVFIPRYDEAVPPQGHTETDAAYRERAELQRRQLFVAMTRARDRLWLGASRN